MSRDRAIEVTEEYLKNYKQIKAHIEILENEKKTLSELLATLPAIEYNSVRVQSSNLDNPTERNAIFLIEKSLYINSDLKNSKNAILKIDKAMSSLNDIQRKVVELSLIENIDWINISQELEYSERQLRRIRNGAVYKIAIALFGATLFHEDVRKMSDIRE